VSALFPSGFLYRRLAGVAPCALLDVAGGELVLRSRWQVGSLRDVFLSTHYWRLFEHLDKPPVSIVDLGGHCGHFVVLCELLLEERFGRSEARYLVVEGLADLVEEIHRTLADTGLTGKCRVVHGLVGLRSGEGQLRSGARSLLDASVVSNGGVERGAKVPYIDLPSHIPDGPIDILKIDIEGSEHDLIDSYPTLFERARLVVMEVHDIGRPIDRLLQALEAAGLKPRLPHISKGPHLLVLYARESHV
jgi:FkbM family methyltransferase